MRKHFVLAVLLTTSFGSFSHAKGKEAENAALVSKAMNELFVKRDTSVIKKYWSDKYVQHNPGIPNGRDDLKGIIEGLPANFKYEPGFVTATDEVVMIHGRYTGWGPKPMVAVDIFKVKDGKLAEHWDVLQEEVTAENSKNGNPMFSPGK